MNTVYSLIDNYVKFHDIQKFSLKPFYWAYENWNKGLILGNNTVAFFHNFHITGVIDKATDLTKNLARIESYSTNVEFSEVGILSDMGNIQQITSDFCFWTEDFVNVILPQDSVFKTIYQGGLHYILLTKHQGSFDTQKEKIIENQKNIILTNN